MRGLGKSRFLDFWLGFYNWWYWNRSYEDTSTDIRLNTTTFNHETNASVVDLGNDTFMAVWQSEDWRENSLDILGQKFGIFENKLINILGQKFDSFGNKIGREFGVAGMRSTINVEDYQLSFIPNPVISAIGDGNSLVVWEHEGKGIYGRILDADGDRIGKKVIVSEDGFLSYDTQPKIAQLSNGNCVVVFSGDDGGFPMFDGDHGVFGQILDENGKRVGDNFQISTEDYFLDEQSPVDVLSLDNGNFMVGYYSSGNGLLVQAFDEHGNAIGDYNESGVPISYRAYSAMAQLDNGNIVAVWHDIYAQEGYVYKVCGQILDENGDKIGEDFEIAGNTNNSPWDFHCDVAAIDNNNFVAVWHAGGEDGLEVYGQILDETGNKISEEFLINDYTAGDQKDPSVEYLGDDNFVVTWESEGQDGSGYGVFSQIFDADDYITEEIYGTTGAADVFDFNNLTDSTEVATDTIMDFEQGLDVIDLQDLGFVEADLGARLTFDIVEGMTTLHDSESDFAVELVGKYILAESDFVFA